MTPADLEALREVPGCGGRVPPDHGILHYNAVQWPNCDACLSLLAEAVIRQAVRTKLTDDEIKRFADAEDRQPLSEATGEWQEWVRQSLLAALLNPTPPTPEEPTP